MENQSCENAQAMEKAPVSESGAFKEILAWSQGRPSWQRDTLRRLVVNGNFADDDLNQCSPFALEVSRHLFR